MLLGGWFTDWKAMANNLLAPDEVLHAPLDQVGAKARNIAKLAKIVSTPAAHVVGSAWHDVYREKGIEGLAELRDWLASMPAGTYAVRSSGIIRSGTTTLFEDGAGLSMAGWFESMIGVASGALFDAIISCYRAAASRRVEKMIATLDAKPRDVWLAVILQPYVPAVRSAVLYTVDPFRLDAGAHMLVSATWGACHALVSGEITGDTYRLPRCGGCPELVRPSPKPWLWVFEERSGLVRKATPTAQVEPPCVTHDDLHSIKEIGVLLENHFGGPQDVELVDTGSTWLPVQTRPIQRASA
jgi:pyruvate,water dikinase